MIFILTCYLIGAGATFLMGFKLLIKRHKFWMNLGRVTLFWPVTLPIFLVELLLKRKKYSHPDKFRFVRQRQLSLEISSMSNPLPLGYLLKRAGLVSESQITRALEVQQTTHRHLRIGEIMANYGWLKQETIDFFADTLPQIRNRPKQPIGQYLKLAKLLDDGQINQILAEQSQNSLRFGEVAVLKGWIKSETIDFFLRYLQGD